MRTFDKIPRTLPNENFPTGDITDERRIQKAHEWFDKVDQYSSDVFANYVKAAYIPTDKDSRNARLTNQLALILTQHWGTLNEDKQNYAIKGYMTGGAFMRQTGFLPDFDADLRTAVANIRNETSAKVFAENTWAGMARSHPNVFAEYEHLYELGVRKFELGAGDSDTLFIAGLSLSYMLSATAWLENDAKISHFSGLVNTSENELDLRTSQFKKFFVKGKPLASDVIIPKE